MARAIKRVVWWSDSGNDVMPQATSAFRPSGGSHGPAKDNCALAGRQPLAPFNAGQNQDPAGACRTMNMTYHARPMVRSIMRLLAVPALVAVLAAGYAGLQLGPSLHAATSSVTQHVQMAELCPSADTHC